VEFLLKGRDFYFLEVNARLQVEHPVTEAIIDRDLVREQIRIAEGEPLSFEQLDLDICGHAIEARLCAEDPATGFLPSPGPVVAWQPSPITARFDSGVEAGSVVAPEFDAMIAKVIVHAPTRREAAAKLARVLETTRVQGLTTNHDFLIATLRTPEFLAGDTTTDFIERVAPAPPAPAHSHLVQAAIAAAIEAQARRRQSARVLNSIPSGWRSTVMPAEQIAFAVGEETIRLGYRLGRDGVFRFTVGDTAQAVTVIEAGKGEVNLTIDGLRASWLAQPEGDQWLVHGPHGDITLRELPRFPAPGGASSTGGLKAPMPGVVLSTAVKPGDAVIRGQLLLVLEAMKMEHRITAPRDGVVAELHVAAKDQVKNGALLLTLAEEKAG
jgi:propionyl-CoA carboxylase alpha chain